MYMLKYFFQVMFLSIILIGCIETQSSKGYQDNIGKKYTIPENNIEVDSNTVFSVFGNPLPPRQYIGKDLKIRLENWEKAKQKYRENPNNLDNIIWYGRWTAYLGLYYEAIKIYSTGLEKFPTSYELLRHRGHRYVTIRQFDLAIEDLQRAAFYSRPAQNKIEEDGISNRYNKSLSNVKFNIWFTLGVAHYLKGSYDKAISSFKKCQTFADNNDLTVKLSDWFYLTYRKIGNEKAAEDLLAPIEKKLKVLENVDYLNRLMVYKGEYTADRVLAYAENDDNSLTPILAYGIGNAYLFDGEIDKAIQIYERILLNKAWNSFEYIAAEVDLKSLQNNL